MKGIKSVVGGTPDKPVPQEKRESAVKPHGSFLAQKISGLFTRRPTNEYVPVATHLTSEQSPEVVPAEGKRASQEHQRLCENAKFVVEFLAMMLASNDTDGFKDHLKKAENFLSLEAQNRGADFESMVSQAFDAYDVSELPDAMRQSIEANLANESCVELLDSSSAGKFFMNSFRLRSSALKRVERIHDAQKKENIGISDCIDHVEALNSLLDDIPTLGGLRRRAETTIRNSLNLLKERAQHGNFHYRPDSARRLIDAMSKLEQRLGNQNDVSRSVRTSLIDLSRLAISTSLGEVKRALLNPETTDNDIVSSLVWAAKKIAEQNDIVEELRKDKPAYSEQALPSADNVTELLKAEFATEYSPSPDRSRNSIPERLQALQSTLSLSRNSLSMKAKRGSDPATDELILASKLLDSVLLAWKGFDSPSSRSDPKRSELSLGLHRALREAFGLAVNADGSGGRDTRRLASDLISDWSMFQEMTVTERAEIESILDRATDGTPESPFFLKNTAFAKDISRTNFVIASEHFLLPSQESKSNYDRTDKIIRSLMQLTEFDTNFAANVVSWLHQGSLSMFVNPKTEGLNFEKWREFNKIDGQGNDAIVPTAQSKGTGQVTFVIDPRPNGQLRIEFRFQSRENSAQRITADGQGIDSFTLPNSTNFWSGRYAVILSRNGAARLDGAFETHNTWTENDVQTDVEEAQ